MQEKRSLSVVLIVLGTMAGVVWLYSVCLFLVCIWHGSTEQGVEALKQFKDFGVFSAGALSGFLARTSVTPKEGEQQPVQTQVVNTAADPVPTVPQTKP
jgi:hypothetical protein